MQICHCGTQAGYPHDAACPFPLFVDDDASVEKWSRERAALVDSLSTPRADWPTVTVTSGGQTFTGKQPPTVADLQYQQHAAENGWPHHDWTPAA